MTGRRVWWYFVTFFGFIASVNAVMVTLAIRTHSGIVTEHPYEKGLAYNQVVEAEEAQEKLGWKGVIFLLPPQGGGREGGIVAETVQASPYPPVGKEILHFTLKDKSGGVITPDKATAHVTRPTQQGMDFTIELKGAETRVSFPEKGLWEVRINASVGDKKYQQSKRIVVE